MDSSVLTYVILGAVLVGFIVLSVLKGLIKALLLGAAVFCALFTYYWISKCGYTYLAFITKDPQEWMVTVAAWSGAIIVFAILFHGLFWFSNVFSWGAKMGTGGTKGIITTILMVGVLFWVAMMGVFYYGTVAELTRARELALSQSDAKHSVSVPKAYKWKQAIANSSISAWITTILPDYDPQRIALCKIVAYLGSLDTSTSAIRRAQIDAYMPKSRVTSRVLSLQVLSEDKTIRAIIARGDMQGLYNHVKITKFLEDSDVREAFKKLDVDTLLGFKTGTLPAPPAAAPAPDPGAVVTQPKDVRKVDKKKH